MKSEAGLKSLMMRQPALTLAVAESLTGGQVQAAITAVSGASNYFLGGVTAYSLDQKVKLLGVNRTHARRVNCVSQRVAVEMARGACDLFGAKLGVATTGYAEPNRAVGIRFPMAWWAITYRWKGDPVEMISGSIELPGATRGEAQERVAAEVLEKLEAYVRELRQ